MGCRVSMVAYEEQTVNELTQRETLIVISNKTTTLYEITRRIFAYSSSTLQVQYFFQRTLELSSILSKNLFLFAVINFLYFILFKAAAALEGD